MPIDLSGSGPSSVPAHRAEPGTPSEPITFAQNLIAAAGGIFLLAGLWTPVMGALVALDEVWIALLLYSPR
jgi:hypothetical protein